MIDRFRSLLFTTVNNVGCAAIFWLSSGATADEVASVAKDPADLLV